jgi:uncharacterized membrane protein
MWIIYSVLCAFSDSLASLFNKQLVAKKQDAFSISVFIHGFGAITMLVIGIITSEKLLGLPLNALLLLIATAASAAAAGVILLLALKKGDLSLIAPIQTITPLLILIIAIFFLDETPKPIGLLGIMLVVIGGILLDKSPKESFRSIMIRIVTYKPALLGVAAAALYALASVFDKGGLKLVSVGVWIFYVYFFVFLFVLPFVLIKKRKEFIKLKQQKALVLSSSVFSVAAIYLQLLALKTALVTYVLSIKRLSSVFAVVLAYIVLNEKKALFRLKGAVLMVVGAILIGIS